ncbi:MAG TPA: alpha/beta family hydrolase [Acidimicrobiales bacterium]
MSPAPSARAGALLLFPGAGSGRDQSTLVALDEGLDLPVARADFPYRKAGRRAPDRPPTLVACVREEAAALAASAGVAPESVVLGGRSMGGRMCSMAVAEGLPAAGLVLIAYPLHPPGRPDRLRVEHLPKIDVPCLFVSGDRDPFGAPDELAAHAATIAGPVTHVTIEGGRHELKGADGRVVAAVADWLATL